MCSAGADPSLKARHWGSVRGQQYSPKHPYVLLELGSHGRASWFQPEPMQAASCRRAQAASAGLVRTQARNGGGAAVLTGRKRKCMLPVFHGSLGKGLLPCSL